MKILLCVLLLMVSTFSYASQPISGSKSAYQYDSAQQLTAPPEGYSPFYINHIGRHGSRYISKPKYEQITHKILKLANEQKQLTEQGQQLLEQIDKIAILNQNNYGALTELGKKDITKIANRMLNHYPTVFQGKQISVLSTTSPRAIDSARAFLQPFSSTYNHLTIQQQQEDEQFLLRFFEYSPAYTEYKESSTVKEMIKSLEKSAQTKSISKNIASKIFTTEFMKNLDNGIKDIDKDKIKTHEFAIALFALYQELLSFGPEVLADNQLNFDVYFTEHEKEWLTKVITAKNYLQIGPAFDTDGIQIKIAAPLLWEVMNSSDAAISNNNIDANFRFAHAETISPLATLLELEGTTTITDDIANYPNNWKAENIIPMGGNIQFIFYHSEQQSKPILVKVLLNEREVHLPLVTESYPYYDWLQVKTFYGNKLTLLGIPNSQEPIKWLATVK